MDITCDCSGEPSVDKTPCIAELYGYPVMVIGASSEATIAVAGETPTVAELQAALGQSGVDKAYVIKSLTNGNLTEEARTEKTGADTTDGLTDVTAIFMALNAKAKLLTERSREDLLKLNCINRIKFWYVTSKGWVFGAKTGYKSSQFFPPMSLPGYGEDAEVAVKFVYEHNLRKTDPARQDDGFLLLDNADIS